MSFYWLLFPLARVLNENEIYTKNLWENKNGILLNQSVEAYIPKHQFSLHCKKFAESIKVRQFWVKLFCI